MLILPFGRRADWIGWVCIVASFVLLIPFTLLIIVGVYDRIREMLRAPIEEMEPQDEREDASG